MLTLVPAALLGFVLGMRHATDADHVIAVTTIVSRQRSVRAASLIGALWGLGHTLTLLIAGGAIVLFGMVISPKLGMSMEFSVGMMLVLLGAWNLKAFWQRLSPGPNDREQAELTDAWLDTRFNHSAFYRGVRPFVVGVVHGMAGSAALALMMLPLMHTPLGAMAYLGVFGIGTIVGMMLITAAIACPFAYGASRSSFFHRRLGLAAGWISLAFGLFMLYDIGVVQGLLIK